MSWAEAAGAELCSVWQDGRTLKYTRSLAPGEARAWTRKASIHSLCRRPSAAAKTAPPTPRPAQAILRIPMKLLMSAWRASPPRHRPDRNPPSPTVAPCRQFPPLSSPPHLFPPAHHPFALHIHARTTPSAPDSRRPAPPRPSLPSGLPSGILSSAPVSPPSPPPGAPGGPASSSSSAPKRPRARARLCPAAPGPRTSCMFYPICRLTDQLRLPPAVATQLASQAAVRREAAVRRRAGLFCPFVRAGEGSCWGPYLRALPDSFSDLLWRAAALSPSHAPTSYPTQ